MTPKSHYSTFLKIAITAAQDAGEHLRAEFNRTGGPRGYSGHAEIDEKAEAIIRQYLSGADPTFGIIGEELSHIDKPSTDSGQHVWVIDPNDGTSSYLKGYRGAAVSIALLRAGVPILGVVYAYCAPDACDDLFAWAEGCGPLTRNGQLIARTWEDTLTANHTVIISQDADRNSLANAEVVAPARFRTMPSIAYRLALVAAGVGEVAVSLGGAVSWDYAAGHALLRGVGGDLLDSSGQSVTYSSTSRGNCGGFCFGGSVKIAQQLAMKSWNGVFQRAEAAELPYPLLQPLKGKIIADTQLLSRAQGCLLGQLAGDALGSLVEFQSTSEIRHRYPEGVKVLADGGTWNTIGGQPTDDSELALMLARTLVQAEKFDLSAIATAYGFWFSSGPFDIGGTTQQALSAAARAVATQQDPAIAAQNSASRNSQANGALMRISPLGIWGFRASQDQLATWARADASLSHPHIVCQDASAVFVVAIREALVTHKNPEEVYQSVKKWAEEAELHPDILVTLKAAETSPPSEYIHQMGWVRIALQNAFYQLLHAPNLKSGVINTVMQGGDTDTNAAIAGALLGAVHGVEAIPEQWLDRVLTCRPIKGLEGVKKPRPVAFWPIDALVLAERLLLVGLAG